MASPGLSLVGFLDEATASHYLREACLPRDGSPAALRAEWEAAREKLGPPSPWAGQPTVEHIPWEHAASVDRLRTLPWLARVFDEEGWELRLVEIAPLISYQLHVNSEHSASLCQGLPQPPSLADLLPVCLPDAPTGIPIQFGVHPHSVLLKSRSLNLRVVESGALNQPPSMLGVRFGGALPLVQVVRFAGRCYLRNGYHRAYQLQRAGATHLPCLFKEMANFEELVGPDAGTFKQSLLESDNPPTCGHFTDERAHAVTLRTACRVIHVTWSEYVVFED